MMSRKAYRKFAQAFAESRGDDGMVDATWVELRDRIIRIFAGDNPRFDRQRFLDATKGD